MFNLIGKIIPSLVFWGIFAYVVWQVPYPNFLTQADISQLVGFFAPLLLALSLSINLFLKNILSSASISLGIISLLILKALDSLNFITTLLVVISTGLLISYFRKVKRRSLTKLPKIRKIKALRR